MAYLDADSVVVTIDALPLALALLLLGARDAAASARCRITLGTAPVRHGVVGHGPLPLFPQSSREGLHLVLHVGLLKAMARTCG